MIYITEQNFEQEVVQAEKPVVIDFWADWCVPCKMLTPVLEELAKDNSFIRIGKVNVDESPELTQTFEVQTIPLLVVIKDSEVIESSVGVKSGDAIRAMVADCKLD